MHFHKIAGLFTQLGWSARVLPTRPLAARTFRVMRGGRHRRSSRRRWTRAPARQRRSSPFVGRPHPTSRSHRASCAACQRIISRGRRQPVVRRAPGPYPPPSGARSTAATMGPCRLMNTLSGRETSTKHPGSAGGSRARRRPSGIAHRPRRPTRHDHGTPATRQARAGAARRRPNALRVADHRHLPLVTPRAPASPAVLHALRLARGIDQRQRPRARVVASRSSSTSRTIAALPCSG